MHVEYGYGNNNYVYGNVTISLYLMPHCACWFWYCAAYVTTLKLYDAQ